VSTRNPAGTGDIFPFVVLATGNFHFESQDEFQACGCIGPRSRCLSKGEPRRTGHAKCRIGWQLAGRDLASEESELLLSFAFLFLQLFDINIGSESLSPVVPSTLGGVL
jgi:hypothetical protein